MRYYIAVVHKDENSAFGTYFPDVAGCFSAADRLDEIVQNATEALAFYAEDIVLPEPRSLDDVRKDENVAADIADGAMLVAIPFAQTARQ